MRASIVDAHGESREIPDVQCLVQRNMSIYIADTLGLSIFPASNTYIRLTPETEKDIVVLNAMMSTP